MTEQRPLLFTIGHSDLAIDDFRRLLEDHAIGTIIDVRSAPGSGRFPHFSRPQLEEHLRIAGIGYRFMGEHLGGRPRRGDLQVPDGGPDWDRVQADPGFEGAVREATELARGGRAALLCAERDPDRCHRGTVLAPVFYAAGLDVAHILADGGLRHHQPGLAL